MAQAKTTRQRRVADQLIARRRADRGKREGREGEVARDWANECATYWDSLVGGGEVAERGEGRIRARDTAGVVGRCVAVTSDSRASCRRRRAPTVFSTGGIARSRRLRSGHHGLFLAPRANRRLSRD